MKTSTKPKFQQFTIGSLYDEVSNRIIPMIEK